MDLFNPLDVLAAAAEITSSKLATDNMLKDKLCSKVTGSNNNDETTKSKEDSSQNTTESNAFDISNCKNVITQTKLKTGTVSLLKQHLERPSTAQLGKSYTLVTIPSMTNSANKKTQIFSNNPKSTSNNTVHLTKKEEVGKTVTIQPHKDTGVEKIIKMTKTQSSSPNTSDHTALDSTLSIAQNSTYGSHTDALPPATTCTTKVIMPKLLKDSTRVKTHTVKVKIVDGPNGPIRQLFMMPPADEVSKNTRYVKLTAPANNNTVLYAPVGASPQAVLAVMKAETGPSNSPMSVESLTKVLQPVVKVAKPIGEMLLKTDLPATKMADDNSEENCESEINDADSVDDHLDDVKANTELEDRSEAIDNAPSSPEKMSSAMVNTAESDTCDIVKNETCDIRELNADKNLVEPINSILSDKSNNSKDIDALYTDVGKKPDSNPVECLSQNGHTETDGILLNIKLKPSTDTSIRSIARSKKNGFESARIKPSVVAFKQDPSHCVHKPSQIVVLPVSQFLPQSQLVFHSGPALSEVTTTVTTEAGSPIRQRQLVSPMKLKEINSMINKPKLITTVPPRIVQPVMRNVPACNAGGTSGSKATKAGRSKMRIGYIGALQVGGQASMERFKKKDKFNLLSLHQNITVPVPLKPQPQLDCQYDVNKDLYNNFDEPIISDQILITDSSTLTGSDPLNVVIPDKTMNIGDQISVESDVLCLDSKEEDKCNVNYMGDVDPEIDSTGVILEGDGIYDGDAENPPSTAHLKAQKIICEAIAKQNARMKEEDKVKSIRNIRMPKEAFENPSALLDHDYCYQVYFDIAINSVVKEKEKRALIKAERREARQREKAQAKEVTRKRKYVRKKPTKAQLAQLISENQQEKPQLSIDAIDQDHMPNIVIGSAENDEIKDELKEGIEDTPTDIVEEKLLLPQRRSRRRETVLKITEEEEEFEKEVRHERENNRVKVCGSSSYQDQFVYFATKKLKSRTRNLERMPKSDIQIIPVGTILPGDIDFMSKLWTANSLNKPLARSVSSSSITKSNGTILPQSVSDNNLPSELSDFVYSYTIEDNETPADDSSSTQTSLPPDGVTSTVLSQDIINSTDLDVDNSPLKGLQATNIVTEESSVKELQSLQAVSPDGPTTSSLIDDSPVKGLQKQDLDAFVQSLTPDDLQQLWRSMNGDTGGYKTADIVEGIGEMVDNLYDDAPCSGTSDTLGEVTANNFIVPVPEIIISEPSECSSTDVESVGGMASPDMLLESLDKAKPQIDKPSTTNLLPQVDSSTTPVILPPGGRSPLKNDVVAGMTSDPDFIALDDLDVDSSSLLSAAVPNINILLNDLSASPIKTTSLPNQGPNLSKFTSPTVRDLTTTLTGSLDQDINNINDTGTAAVERSSYITNSNKGEPSMESFTKSVPDIPDNNCAPELTAVHMFWNTFPGLVINNVQYVRLVDIHKQALPAKDTGLLKKRCQSMGLQITNCTDMQRDFLIRYARATHSKSTVIVSKETAERLISYYVNPQPKVIRRSSGGRNIVGRPPSQPLPDTSNKNQEIVPLPVKDPPSSSDSAETNVGTTNEESAGSNVKKKVKKLKLKLQDDTNLEKSPTPTKRYARRPSFTPAKRSLRNHKISFSWRFDWSDTEDDGIALSPRKQEKSSRKDSVENTLSQPETIPDTINSKKKSNKRSDSKAIKIVQEKLQVDCEGQNGVDSGVDIPCTPDSNNKQEKSGKLSPRSKKLDQRIYLKDQIKKLQRRLNKAKSAKLSKTLQSKLTTRLESKQRLLTKGFSTSPALTPKTDSVLIRKKGKFSPKKLLSEKENNSQATGNINNNNKHCKKPSKVKAYLEQPFISLKDTLSVGQQPKPCFVGLQKQTVIAISHRNVDCTDQTNHATQDGELYFDFYKTEDSLCICCSSCNKFLTVCQFMRHLHNKENDDELIAVKVMQKLELRDDSLVKQRNASWEVFLNKHEQDLTKQGDNIVSNHVVSQGIRQSSRMRKRKQLHPMEKYDFSKQLPPTCAAEIKKPRHDSDLKQTDLHLLDCQFLSKQVAVDVERNPSITPLEKVMTQFEGNTSDLCQDNSKPEIDSKTECAVITKQVENVDSLELTALKYIE